MIETEMPGEQDNLEDMPSDATLNPEGGSDAAADDLVRQLQGELDEAIEARKRALADFKNYQRRALENEQRAGAMAAARVVKAIMPVLDHFDLALGQKPEQMTAENLLQAVRIVRDEFNRALASQGVERIEPKPGEPFDPHRHEAVMQQPAKGAAPNTIVATLQAGHALGEMVLRPAKVSVAASE
jgi:molecular chaperone GrpE